MATKIVNPFAMKSISKKYLKSDLADVHFTFPNDDGNEMVPAHKLILAFASSVFDAMFFGPLKEGNVVKIDDTTAGAFKEFLQLVYLPEINLTMQNFEEVLRLVDKYDMIDCIDTIVPFLERNITKENLPITYQLAIKFNNAELKSYCERIIRSLTKDFLASKAFSQCTRDVVQHVLQQNVLECDEFDLFKECMGWAKSACRRNGIDVNNADNLKNQLGDCFRLIRFGAMDGKDLTKILSNELYDQLFTREELKDFMQMKIDPSYKSKIFNSNPRAKALTELNKLFCDRAEVQNGEKYVAYNASGSSDRRYSQMSTSANNRGRHQNEDTYPGSTCFSTNAPILLKGIRLNEARLHLLSSDSMEIIEYNSRTIAKIDDTFRTYETVKSYHSYRGSSRIEVLVCDPPIIINSKKIYEIRPTHPPRPNAPDSNELSLTSVKVNDEITISFHQDPSDCRSSLVSGLVFYPL